MFEQAIEKKREKMMYFAERYGITSQKTVICSQELDRLLNVVLVIDAYCLPTQNTDTDTH
ncbi:aspartyl-phosphate phosphatase Spo0E family protein [Bacillus sp. DX1.1]|uniref:aspartyl-phosphate phosphatase Spo0E family protein n=1 Tax=unclassified Bacillus (in: firmicutes) TaxID=185979 RepID=UPI00256FA807|nr:MULTISPECIES: aspartyl-phosphate phosphatase Spo0E family protein [unclassified Bacillus (in: firmicutes)]MDM5153798.1 aspartyl-phosphate phosphatase Spo0E family protein [Bacillus sp. DX1.1]WJE82735.1 aspartyl-phosphate phosphatase Spo0E family protein [Bacillus sp. DX3.1]